jgi:ATP-binding cassette subfamily B protein
MGTSDSRPANPGLSASAELSTGQIVKRLLRLTWRYRAGCLKVMGFQIVLLGLGIAALGLAGQSIDYLRHVADPKVPLPRWPFGLHPPAAWPPLGVIGWIAGLILALAALRAVLTFAYSMALVRLVQQGLVVDLRAQVYDKLQRLSFRFFDANETGTLINRITGDVQSVRLFVDGVVIQVVILLITLGWYLGYMLRIHARLTLACLATVPLLWLISTVFTRRVKPAYTRSRDLADRLILNVSESTQGMHVIKGFAREAARREGFAEDNRVVREQKQSIFWAVTVYSPTVEFLSQISLIILLGFGGYLVVRGSLPFGAGLIVFLGLLQRFSSQVSTIASVTDHVQQSLAAARRVFEVLDAPVEVASPPGARRLTRCRGGLAFEHVEFAYEKGTPVLRDVSFALEPGQCVAILGMTGAGKSTLLSLIPRFYDATGGRIRLDGEDVRDLHLDDLRRQVGLVFQESFLFSNTVAANIAFGHPDATPEQIERAARVASAHEFIARLPKGYDTVLGEGGMDLSGGQRQRLAIARAVLLEPPLLLLDDPTAAVDPATENEILDAVDGAVKGRTTILVTQRLSVLRRADLILVLHRGRIEQQGTHDQLLRQAGVYRRATRIQTDPDLLPALGPAAGGSP